MIWAGVGWFTKFTSLVAPGHLGFRPLVNTSAPLYSVMKAGFNKYWSMDHKKGLNTLNASEPTWVSAASFNAIIALSYTLHTMFFEFSPPVYADSPVCLTS